MIMKKQKEIIIVLIALLVVAGGYIALDKYNEGQLREKNEIARSAALIGYEQAIIEIARMAATCQFVPLIVQNQTINLVAVECLTSQ